MAKKASKKRPAKLAAVTGRVRKLSKKQARQKAKKEAGKQPPIPGSFNLTRTVFANLRKFWKPLGGIFLVYLILNVVFASGFIGDINSSVGTVRNNLHSSHSLSKAISGYGTLLGSGAGGSQTSSVAQSALLVLESLVIIWALRRLLAGEAVRVKLAYYQSTAQLVPFALVIFVIILQLLPLTVGAALLALVLSSAIGGSLLSVIFWVLLALLAAWSIYMLSSSVFALYIVTLPDMQPRQALRSAKNLVRFRRWYILRRLLFLPICILLLMGLVMIPIILLLPFLATVVFFILAMAAITFVHAYLYNLYRGLIA